MQPFHQRSYLFFCPKALFKPQMNLSKDWNVLFFTSVNRWRCRTQKIRATWSPTKTLSSLSLLPSENQTQHGVIINAWAQTNTAHYTHSSNYDDIMSWHHHCSSAIRNRQIKKPNANLICCPSPEFSPLIWPGLCDTVRIWSNATAGP